MIKSMHNVPFETLRFGKISAVDTNKCMARVLFEDREDVVSPFLPVMQKNTLNSKFYWMPEVDEIAICLFSPNGQESGVIIGTVYAEDDEQLHKPVPEISDDGKDRDGIWFEDGTYIKYEHDTKTLEIDVKGKINIRATDDITINGKNVFIN